MDKSHLQFTKKLAREAGKIIKDNFRKNLVVKEKSIRNLVTNIDCEVEKFIIQKIKKQFPDHDILAEESGKNTHESPSKKSTTAAYYRWIIDPLDGTTNYVHGLPFVAISIALEYKKEVILGLVYNPILNEMFWAEKTKKWKEKGAFFNNEKIQVSKTKTLGKAVLATGFHPENCEKNLFYFEKFIKKVQGIRRYGSAALDLCYVAVGRLDGFWEFDLSIWDVAAGSLIIAEAGGRVTNIDGTALNHKKRAILGTNGKIHPIMKKILSQSNLEQRLY